MDAEGWTGLIRSPSTRFTLVVNVFSGVFRVVDCKLPNPDELKEPPDRFERGVVRETLDPRREFGVAGGLEIVGLIDL